MEIDRQVIVACLAGEATPQERALLQGWRNADPENEAAFQRQARIWELLGLVTEEESDFQVRPPQAHIPRRRWTSPRRPARLSWFRRFGRYLAVFAASLFGLLVLVWLDASRL